MIIDIYTDGKGKPGIGIHGQSAKDTPEKIAKAYKTILAELKKEDK